MKAEMSGFYPAVSYLRACMRSQCCSASSQVSVSEWDRCIHARYDALHTPGHCTPVDILMFNVGVGDVCLFVTL